MTPNFSFVCKDGKLVYHGDINNILYHLNLVKEYSYSVLNDNYKRTMNPNVKFEDLESYVSKQSDAFKSKYIELLRLNFRGKKFDYVDGKISVFCNESNVYKTLSSIKKGDCASCSEAAVASKCLTLLKYAARA